MIHCDGVGTERKQNVHTNFEKIVEVGFVQLYGIATALQTVDRQRTLRGARDPDVGARSVSFNSKLPISQSFDFLVSKSVRSLIDWRQLARSAIRVLKDEHVPADNFVRTLEYDTFPKDSRIDEEDRLAGEQALRFVEAHRKELDERGEPKNAKAICCQISRYCLCIECERKCAMRWFGHRLHDRCREKNKEKYALLGHNEARSLPESKGFVVAPLYVFQMPSTNTMRLQMVWKRQYLVRLQRMRNEKIRNERAKASTSTSTSESSTQSRKKRKL